MASTNTQKQAARASVREWSGEGYEKGETQRFWIDLLYTVFGIDNPTKMMEFELPVKTITKEKGSDIVVRLSGRRKTLPQRISPRQLSRLDDGLPTARASTSLSQSLPMGDGRNVTWRTFFACAAYPSVQKGPYL